MQLPAGELPASCHVASGEALADEDTSRGIAQDRGDDANDVAACAQFRRPWQCLYFLPEPHGQGSLRPTLPQLVGLAGSRAVARCAPMPLPADGTSDTSASAISSSPVTGSTLCASM